MYNLPIEFFNRSGSQSRHIPKPLPTASLIAYYDFALTSSYVTGSSVVYDLSGNGYHGYLTGSMPLMVTSNFSFYPKQCIYFNTPSSGFIITSSLTTIFGNQANDYYCNTPPTYSNDYNFSAIIIAKSDYYESGAAKSVFRAGTKIRFLNFGYDGNEYGRYIIYYGLGTGQDSNIDATQPTVYPYSSSMAAFVLTKECNYFGKAAVNSIFISSSYNPLNSGSVGNLYGNNVLYSTPSTAIINENNKSFIEAILLYNKKLSPDDVFYAVDYFKYRKF